MKSFIRWAIFFGVLGWAGYIVAGAGWSYFAAQEIVDQVLRDVSSRNRTPRGSGSQTTAVAEYIQAAIALGAQREGLAVHESDVNVSVSAGGLSATIHWPHPVITYRGNDILVIPMSLERSVVPPP